MNGLYLALIAALLIASALAARYMLRLGRRRQYSVREVDEFLSHEECEHIIELSRPLLTKGLVKGTDGNRADKGRRAEMADVEKTKDRMLKTIKQRIADLVGLPQQNFEALQVIRYGVGGLYVAHVDYLAGFVDEIGPAGDRLRSVILYLNDDYDGGQTLFPKIGYAVQPKKGKAVVFDNLDSDHNPQPLSRHSGLAVLKGEKWIVNLIVREAANVQSGNRAERRRRASRAH